MRKKFSTALGLSTALLLAASPAAAIMLGDMDHASVRGADAIDKFINQCLLPGERYNVYIVPKRGEDSTGYNVHWYVQDDNACATVNRKGQCPERCGAKK